MRATGNLLGGIIPWGVRRFVAFLVVLAVLVGAFQEWRIWYADGERRYVARVLGISSQDVLPPYPRIPLCCLKASDESGSLALEFEFRNGRVGVVSLLPDQRSALARPTATPRERADRAVRGAIECLGATEATVVSEEAVTEADGGQYHRVYVEVHGDSTRLFSRYFVLFHPNGAMGLIAANGVAAARPYP